MIRFFVSVLSILLLILPSFGETIVLTQAGTLADVLSELDVDEISDLTLKGPINSDDIKTLRSGDSPLSNIVYLNLKDVTFVYSENSYYSFFWDQSMYGVGSPSYTYYLSDKNSWIRHQDLNGTYHYEIHTTKLEYAFCQITSLKHVVLPDAIKEIGEGTFMECINLETVEFPSHITAINGKVQYGRRTQPPYYRGSFSRCTSLKSITLPASITSIGVGAFLGCSQLSQVSLPDKAMRIDRSAFYDTPFWETKAVVENDVKYLNHFAMEINENATSVHFREGTLAVADNFAKGNASISELSLPSSVQIIGSYAFSGNEGLKNVSFPERLTQIAEYAFSSCKSLSFSELPTSLKSIGNYAFQYCIGCTELTIPEDVELGEGAFSGNKGITKLNLTSSKMNNNSVFGGCESLEEVILGPKVVTISQKMFSGCTSLKQIDVSASVDTIGNDAFHNCENLNKVVVHDLAKWCSIYLGSAISNSWSMYSDQNTCLNTIVIPNGVTCIGQLAFGGCRADTIKLPQTVKTIEFGAFQKCCDLTTMAIPSNVTSIGSGAFSDCTCLTSITIPENVESIGSGAFRNCPGLTSVTIESDAFVSMQRSNNWSIESIFGAQVQEYVIGNAVKSIGEYAFYKCTGLTSIIIPNSVTSIGYSAFNGCSGLTSITIPNSVTSIGISAFSRCSSLTSITIPNSLTSIGNYIFNGCSSLTSVTIPNSVTSIGDSAFYGCSSLTSAAIGNSVTSIGNSAFRYCSSLTSITIPNSVTSIGNYAFSGCNGLTSIDIPNNVESIGENAFYQCSGLISIKIPNNVTSIEKTTFSGCSGLNNIIIGSNVTSIGGVCLLWL